MRKRLFLATALLAVAGAAWSQVSYVGGTYNESFDTLTSGTWTDDSTLVGWYSNRTSYFFSTGTGTAGGLYAYGASSGAEKALGALSSGSADPVLFAVRVRNNTGGTLTSFTLSFRGEQWRSADTAVETLFFDYKIGASGITDTGFTGVSSLDFDSPNVTGGGAVDGNDAANRESLAETVNGLNWADGSDLWLRWSKPDTAGSDHGLAIDDLAFSASAAPVPEPFTLLLGAAALGAARRRRQEGTPRPSGQRR
ncbi:MAG: hypothetical protein M9921_09365 [Fimbriimonadaceae bacterium]|nr:hypothetical protein [Fimbriimonadaceae bacterium]